MVHIKIGPKIACYLRHNVYTPSGILLEFRRNYHEHHGILSAVLQTT